MKQAIKYTKTTCIDIEDEFCSLDCVHLTFWCNLFQVNLTKEGKKIKRCKKCLEAKVVNAPKTIYTTGENNEYCSWHCDYLESYKDNNVISNHCILSNEVLSNNNIGMAYRDKKCLERKAVK